MLSIGRLTVENLREGCVTDEPNPRFSYALESDSNQVRILDVVLKVGNWICHNPENQVAIAYAGESLEPCSRYQVHLEVQALVNGHEESAKAETSFETGLMGTPWQGQWISDGSYHFTEKKVSPRPMVLKRTIRLSVDKDVLSARLYATAMGIYDLSIDGQRIGDRYFAPGFTSYGSNLQYQTYDVTEILAGGVSESHKVEQTISHKAPEEKDTKGRSLNRVVSKTIQVCLAGGWAVGSFVFTRVNRISADRQAFLAQLVIRYKDGSQEIIGTDESWQVSEDGPVTMADWYDGESYDANRRAGVDVYGHSTWHQASLESLRTSPLIQAEYGDPVRAHEIFRPLSCTCREDGELIYDLGQNFAGVIRLRIRNGKAGQSITIRHAEILNPDGSLNTRFLRTAKATIRYVCKEGYQEYSPRFTYMGFRYLGVRGLKAEDFEIEGVALYSDLQSTGDFSCSNSQINQLQSNIVWGAKSNFVDIPTDCPQRDERMGWTGDIAVFSPTACYNFDMSRFLNKWLRDVRAEQTRGGGIPNTVPVQGYGFPATMPKMAIDWWGDACVLVPWALYQARGDIQILSDMYSTMKRYVEACRFWASLVGLGKKRYIWHTPHSLHFGDWVAPDLPKMSQWQKRSKWTATASLYNTSQILSRVAGILGKQEDSSHYRDLADKVADAYCSVFTDGQGRMLKGGQFQTAYVLPLHLGIFPEEVKRQAATNLADLVASSGYTIGTGFPGTPYILFALADNGQVNAAYRLLLNQSCPGWLYEIRMGATTIWERWNGLDESGQCPIGDDGTDLMISYNHYASGAVGAFLYQRIAGIVPLEAGYKVFGINPLLGGGLTWARGRLETPYGLIESDWTLHGERFAIEVTVPIGSVCHLTLPNDTEVTLSDGHYRYAIELPEHKKKGEAR